MPTTVMVGIIMSFPLSLSLSLSLTHTHTHSSMRRCGTQGYDRDAFGTGSYERNTLQRLHLSGNNLTILERRGFRNLDDLQELYVDIIVL